MTAGSTYTPLATTTLGSAQASYTFSSISGSYTDLHLIIAGSIDGADPRNVLLQFNNDTGTNYSVTILYGDGTSAASDRVSNDTAANVGGLSNSTQSNTIVEIMNYSNSTTYKTCLGRGNRPADQVNAKVSLWRSTSAITSIKVFMSNAQNLASGTTLTLYGIASA